MGDIMSEVSIKKILGKTTVRGILALIFGITACIGFFKGLVDPKDFVVFVTIILNFLFSERRLQSGQ